MRQVRFLLKTCLTITTIVVQSGASRQENQNKERHTMTKMMNFDANKMTTIFTISRKRLFSHFKQKNSKIVTTYSLHTKKESMKNVIAYVDLKNKKMAHITSLKNGISCVVRIYIFGFNTYWKQVLDLMKIQKTQTFKHFFKAKTINGKKNKS